jgi:hypothetical protein
MSPAIFGPIFLLILLVIIGGILLAVFFNLTLQRSMAAVSKPNQSIVPGLIWLNFIPIPILNTVWTMVFGIMACKAMNKDAGKKIAPINLAIIYPSLSLLISVLSFSSSLFFSASRDLGEMVSLLVGLLSLTTIVLWIIFWVQMKIAKNKLKTMNITSTDSESLDSGFIDDEF